MKIADRAERRFRLAQRGLSKVEWVIVIAIVAIGCSVLLSMSQEQDGKARRVKERAAPVIAGLERYKSEKGSYPAQLSALVPAYVASVPKCSDNDTVTIPYWVDEKTRGFQLACPLGMFVKLGYSSASREWSTFD